MSVRKTVLGAFTLLLAAAGASAGQGNSRNINTERAAAWQPSVGASWQIVLLNPLEDASMDVEIYDIDLFLHDKSDIDDLKSQGKKVICYFSAGSYEDWREDKNEFDEADLGAELDGWPGERWLDLSTDNVRRIMAARLDVAERKGCDAVDPDNVDGYDNENGLGLTEDDTVDFVEFLSDAAQARGMSIGLKNAASVIPRLIDSVQFSVNEQCVEYEEWDECTEFAAFIQAGKPVFHIEYPKGEVNNDDDVSDAEMKRICEAKGTDGFSTLAKNLQLDVWAQTC